jgi:hypothetical protein
MITIARRAQAANGKFPEAIAFAQKVTDYLSKNHNANITVHRQIGGNPFRIIWVNRFDDMMAYSAFMEATMSDPKYLEILQNAGDLFTEGSVSDVMSVSL